MFLEGGAHAVEAVEQLHRDLDLFLLRLRQHILEIDEETAQVVEGHHGYTVADEGVVGVVPFGALGVHPDAALGDEVGHLGEHGRHDFLDEVDLVDEDVGLAQERTVPSNFILLEFHLLLPFVVELDGVLGVLQQIVIALDAVGDVGVDEGVVLEIRLELLRVVVPKELEEFQQVDDLVVAPVTDVRPRVVGLDGLPFEAVLEHAVGVVPVEGGGVEELEDHALDELGIGVDKGFPILEDVAPVALVVEDLGAVFLVAEVDGKPVPRAARVSVAAAELQRQVLGAQALEVEVLGLGGLLLQEEEVELFGPRGHGLLFLEEDLVVGPVDVGHEVGPLDGVVLVEDAAAHDVEHRVREVSDVAAAVGRELQAVAGRDQGDEALGAFLDVGEDRFAKLVG